jgi:hypothetical protein
MLGAVSAESCVCDEKLLHLDGGCRGIARSETC